MATKKQKRAAALARREAFMAQLAADGKAAQEWDRQRRETKAEKARLSEEEKSKRDRTAEALQKLLSVG
jgi:hypothetical protein